LLRRKHALEANASRQTGVHVAKEKSKGLAKRASGLKKTARRVKDKTVKAAGDHPLVAEVVAAALVGAAAALKDPAKARELAASAADEITAIGKKSDAKGAALWLLALDIARRSMNSMVGEGTGATAKKGGKSSARPKKKKKAA